MWHERWCGLKTRHRADMHAASHWPTAGAHACVEVSIVAPACVTSSEHSLGWGDCGSPLFRTVVGEQLHDVQELWQRPSLPLRPLQQSSCATQACTGVQTCAVLHEFAMLLCSLLQTAHTKRSINCSAAPTEGLKQSTAWHRPHEQLFHDSNAVSIALGYRCLYLPKW